MLLGVLNIVCWLDFFIIRQGNSFVFPFIWVIFHSFHSSGFFIHSIHLVFSIHSIHLFKNTSIPIIDFIHSCFQLINSFMLSIKDIYSSCIYQSTPFIHSIHLSQSSISLFCSIQSILPTHPSHSSFPLILPIHIFRIQDCCQNGHHNRKVTITNEIIVLES
jgi:hypothetical protein